MVAVFHQRHSRRHSTIIFDSHSGCRTLTVMRLEEGIIDWLVLNTSPGRNFNLYYPLRSFFIFSPISWAPNQCSAFQFLSCFFLIGFHGYLLICAPWFIAKCVCRNHGVIWSCLAIKRSGDGDGEARTDIYRNGIEYYEPLGLDDHCQSDDTAIGDEEFEGEDETYG